ncbi:hypothetical protein SEVIR_1G375750v4 [Setaria viridis]
MPLLLGRASRRRPWFAAHAVTSGRNSLCSPAWRWLAVAATEVSSASSSTGRNVTCSMLVDQDFHRIR